MRRQRLAGVLPPSPLARRLTVQSVLFAVGQGTFVTGSAVFFTQVVGLSVGQVGLGLTLAGVATFTLAVPGGRLADRIGAQRAWAVGALLVAGLYATWPLIHGIVGYVAVLIALEVVASVAGAGRGAYTLDALPSEERVRSQAFMRAALNIGFTLGALISGVALAFDSDAVIRAVPLLTALIQLANAWWVWRLPAVPREAAPLPLAHAPQSPAAAAVGALRNRGFVLLTFFDGVLGTNQVLLNVVIPLWLVQETDAPRVLLAWLFATNTVMTVALQVAAARGVDSVEASLRAARVSGAFFVASCLIVLVTDETVGWLTVVLIGVAHLTVTGAELFQSAGQWGLLSELTDASRRGEYLGAAQLGGTLGSVWAPAAYTFLVIRWGTPGWLLIAAVVAAAVVGMHPSARMAQRHLALTDTAAAA